MEDSGLQGWLRPKEAGRGGERDGGLDESGNGRRLQTSESEHEKGERGSTSGQTWEVDVGKKWISSEHQAISKQVASDPLEKNATRNTTRTWWVALETMKKPEDCLKKLNHEISLKRRNWATQQKAEINKLEPNQVKRLTN